MVVLAVVQLGDRLARPTVVVVVVLALAGDGVGLVLDRLGDGLVGVGALGVLEGEAGADDGLRRSAEEVVSNRGLARSGLVLQSLRSCFRS